MTDGDTTEADLAPLVVTVGRRRHRVEPGESAVVGRGADATIDIDAPGISRRHALIAPENGGWVLTDLDSTYGVFRQRERITRVAVNGPVSVRLGHPETGPLLKLAPLDPAAEDEESPRGGHAATESLRPAHAAARAEDAPGDEPPARSDAEPDYGSLSIVHEAGQGIVTIGRAPDNDVVVADLGVSRHHAELRNRESSGPELVDLDSFNGTFVNGQPVTRTRLRELDVVDIGAVVFRWVAGRLEEYGDTGEVAFEAHGLSFVTDDGTVLLDDVSVALPARGLLAVVGPSGSGKSTLLRALTGLRPATSGSVSTGGRDLYANYDDLRRRIGFVPQDDVLHESLTVRRALQLGAELRFPYDVSADERNERVDEVLSELGLSHRADLPVHALSGGQRKRTSGGLELLTKPSLLFLDEPTSGLDPGYERSLMVLLRELADSGRTVVVVTHAVQSLRLCDRVLLLAPGGRTAYFGPPQLATGFFEEQDYEDIFIALERDGADHWTEAFAGHPHHTQYLAAPLAAAADDDDDETSLEPHPPPVRTSWWRQFSTLTRRYLEVIASDRRNLALLVLQAPVLGLIMLVALSAGQLTPPPAGEVRLISSASVVLFVIILGVTWLGASNAIREVVKELPIYRRERAAGLSVSAYIASKAVVLGVLTVMQAVLLVAIALGRQDGPPSGVVIGWGLGEVMVVVALAGLAAMALGLLLSTVMRSTDRAMAILPVVLILQFVLTGGMFPVHDSVGLRELSYLSSAQWGYAGTASTVDLNALQSTTNVVREFTDIDPSNPEEAIDRIDAGLGTGYGGWDHQPGAWWTSVGALLVLTTAGLVAAGLVLRRMDPG